MQLETVSKEAPAPYSSSTWQPPVSHAMHSTRCLGPSHTRTRVQPSSAASRGLSHTKQKERKPGTTAPVWCTHAAASIHARVHSAPSLPLSFATHTATRNAHIVHKFKPHLKATHPGSQQTFHPSRAKQRHNATAGLLPAPSSAPCHRRSAQPQAHTRCECAHPTNRPVYASIRFRTSTPRAGEHERTRMDRAGTSLRLAVWNGGA